jgi:hypothetical protein
VVFLLCSIFGAAIPATDEGGQASRDYSWFGSITNVFFMKQKIYEQYQCQWGFVTEIS